MGAVTGRSARGGRLVRRRGRPCWGRLCSKQTRTVACPRHRPAKRSFLREPVLNGCGGAQRARRAPRKKAGPTVLAPQVQQAYSGAPQTPAGEAETLAVRGLGIFFCIILAEGIFLALSVRCRCCASLRPALPASNAVPLWPRAPAWLSVRHVALSSLRVQRHTCAAAAAPLGCTADTRPLPYCVP